MGARGAPDGATAAAGRSGITTASSASSATFHRRPMIRAVIWKEVREQGLIGLMLVVLGFASIIVSLLTEGNVNAMAASAFLTLCTPSRVCRARSFFSISSGTTGSPSSIPAIASMIAASGLRFCCPTPNR